MRIDNKIGNEGAAHLAYHLYDIKEMKVLNINDNEISKSGIYYIKFYLAYYYMNVTLLYN